MVQYVFTPWRDRQELVKVRQQFYPQHHPPVSSTKADQQHAPHDRQQEQQHEAVARVSMWMQRGNCPHMVESTALLTAAILSDQQAATTASIGNSEGERESLGEDGRLRTRVYGSDSGSGAMFLASSTYAARAAYSTAFSRFVTGLLDSHQERQHKMSMYAIAKSVGLPATFVELRHQATHEQLPSLARLRATARKALDWIYNYYWKHMTETPDTSGTASAVGAGAELPDLVDQYADEADPTRQEALREQIMAWGDEPGAVAAALDALLADVRDTKKLKVIMGLYREAVHQSLSIAPKAPSPDVKEADPSRDLAFLRDEMQGMRDELENFQSVDQTEVEKGPVEEREEEAGPAWSRHEGPWIPRPIGMV